MPPLSQLSGITGRPVRVDEEALIQARLPSLYAARERQVQAENLALARREQELNEEQAAESAKQIGRATTIQSLSLLPSSITSVEAIKPGTLAGLGKLVGLGGSSGAAAASGLTTSASGVAGGVGTAAAFPAFGGASAAGTAAAEGAVAASTIPATTGPAATGTLASLGAYALPAAGGFVAGKIGGAIGPHILPFGGKTGERVERDVTATAAGAGAGALTGAAIGSAGGPIGAVGGAIIGGVAGLLGAESVIATAVGGRDAPETQTAQAFRRRFVGPTTYAGYLRWGKPIARWLTAHPRWKPLVAWGLVRPATRYFQARLDGQRAPLWLRGYIGNLYRLSHALGRWHYRSTRRAKSRGSCGGNYAASSS